MALDTVAAVGYRRFMSDTRESFNVSIIDFEQLSSDEKRSASYGLGKDYSNYIRVIRNGKTVYLESDAMEPEDARFTRDLKWVKEAIEYAYQCGKSDTLDQNTGEKA